VRRALKQADAREAGYRTGCWMTQYRERLTRRIGDRGRHRRTQIDVTRSAHVHAAEIEITNRQARIRKQLTLDAYTSLLYVRLGIVFREQVKTRIHASGARRSAEDGGIDRTRIRNESAVQTDARYLYSVLRVRGPQHDRWCAPKEDPIAAAQHGLVVKRVAET